MTRVKIIDLYRDKTLQQKFLQRYKYLPLTLNKKQFINFDSTPVSTPVSTLVSVLKPKPTTNRTLSIDNEDLSDICICSQSELDALSDEERIHMHNVKCLDDLAEYCHYLFIAIFAISGYVIANNYNLHIYLLSLIPFLGIICLFAFKESTIVKRLFVLAYKMLGVNINPKYVDELYQFVEENTFDSSKLITENASLKELIDGKPCHISCSFLK